MGETGGLLGVLFVTYIAVICINVGEVSREPVSQVKVPVLEVVVILSKWDASINNVSSESCGESTLSANTRKSSMVLIKLFGGL